MDKKVILASLLAAFALSGCGGSSSKPISSSSQEQSSSSVISSSHEESSSSSSESKESTQNANYNVNVYLETLDGQYTLNNGLSYVEQGKIGTSVHVEPKDIKGFSFDELNDNNKLSIILNEEGNVLSIYYKRNEYSITVLGGTASKTRGKYQEEITLTPNVTDATLILNEGSTAKVNGNVITLGEENVVATFSLKTKYVLSELEMVKATDSIVSANIDIKDNTNLVGLVTLFNTSESVSKAPRYYLLGAKGTKVTLYLFDEISLNPIKETTVDDLTLGMHCFQLAVTGEGNINCYIDNVKVMGVSKSEITALELTPITSVGKAGIYSNKYYFDFNTLTVSKGAVSLDDIKESYINEKSSFTYSKHELDTTNFTVKDGNISINVKDVNGYKDLFNTFVNDMNAAISVDQVERIAEQFEQTRINAMKDYTKESLYKLLKDIHYSVTEQHSFGTTVTCLDTNVTVNDNYLDRDLRTWVPSAYKLRGAKDEICLLDQLDLDLANASKLEDVYKISDTYHLDLARALAYHDYEMYFWQAYAINQNATFPVWGWYLYNYIGASGDGFSYVGNVYKNYTWTKDYRLSKAFYGSLSDRANDLYTVISFLNYLITAQTIQAMPYTVTLNADGGEIDSTILEGSSSSALTLPTPVKEGYTFDGWYLNRLGQGTKYTSIAAGNIEDFTLYASYKKNNEKVSSDILPNAFITENMVIPQNKEIVFSGTGKDGVNVHVSFDNEEHDVVISDGKWEVVFEPRSASFEPKTIIISGEGITYTFNDVLIGEVWLCAGQSNMEMLLSWLSGKGADYIGEYRDFKNLDKIRIFRQCCDDIGTDGGNMDNDRWCKGNRVDQFYDKSIVSIAFACALEAKLNVPVGVITSARGGTYIEEWLSEEALARTGSIVPEASKSIESRYYNQMYKDLIGQKVSGVYWYQGENNVTDPDRYINQYKELVNQYREMFEDDNLIVIAQQLAQYGTSDYKDFRLMQQEVAKEISNAYCNCGLLSGEKDDIHPAEKIAISVSAADIALDKFYHVTTDSLSYEPVKAEVKDGKVVVSFENGKKILPVDNVDYILVKMSNGTFVDVEAKLVNDQIVFDYIEGMVEVYYAYAAYLGPITLFGGNNKPIAPFKLTINF